MGPVRAGTFTPSAAWPTEDGWEIRSQGVFLLQVYALTLMVFPSDVVIDAVGAAGFVGSLIALFAFGLWATSFLLGFYNPLAQRSPVRVGFVGLWIVSLASYAIMNTGERSGAEVLGADRWLMQLAAGTGIAFIAAEWPGSLDEVRRVARALVWGGAFCGVVAGLQFWAGLDLAVYLRMVPGLALNADNAAISSRAALNRVAGTAIHPIELGVVAGMILPLAAYLAMYDTALRPWRRWLPVVCVGIAIPASVSRSAVVSVTIALGLFILMLPAAQRIAALGFSTIAVVAMFATAPGLISTLTAFFLAGTNDPSVATRVDDYPFVERAVASAPLLGRGGATFMARDAFEILDNQYLKTAIELGLIGLVVLALLYFLVPVLTAALARREARGAESRALAGALVGSAAAAMACSFTFDSLSFPMFTGVHALVVGLAGACWRLARVGDETAEHGCS